MARRKKINPVQVFLTVWQLGRQRPLALLLLVLVLASGFWYGYELYIARPGLVYMGIPKAQNWTQPSTWTRIFRNDGFMVGYSDLWGNPLWVSYQIKSIQDDTHYQRPQRFSTDWRNLTHITPDDYRHSGYDRGHMAPNYAISRLYGETAQLDTFLMTNITPQKPNLNRKLWQRLEEVEIDHFTQQFKTVWVLTGPIFDPNIERLKSSYWVEIPDAFYKIYFALPDKKMLAFIVPQEVRGKEPLDHFLVSVDEVEEKIGFDFFHELEDTREEQLESSIKSAPWRLKEVARLPARY